MKKATKKIRTIYLNYKNKVEKNTDGAEEVEDSGKRKSKQTKESFQKKQIKREVEETYPLSRFT